MHELIAAIAALLIEAACDKHPGIALFLVLGVVFGTVALAILAAILGP